jgi:hypothetical protein
MTPAGEGEDYRTNLTIPFGYYETMQEVVNAINLAVGTSSNEVFFPLVDVNGERRSTKLDQDKLPHLKYNEVKKKIFIHLHPGTSIHFDDYMVNVLGVRSNPVVNNSKIPKLIGANRACDLKGGIHGLYVYCDILENVAVGDTEAPLLRVVDAGGHNGENIHRVFDPPRYVPLRSKHFDSIEIDIRDDIGQPISFESGTLTLTLHFRRAASPYFSS